MIISLSSGKDNKAISLGSFLSSPQKTQIGSDIRLVYSDGGFCDNNKKRIRTILTLKCKPGRLKQIRSSSIIHFNSFLLYRNYDLFLLQETWRALPSFAALRLIAVCMSWSGTPPPLVFSQRHRETTAGLRILKLVRLE